MYFSSLEATGDGGTGGIHDGSRRPGIAGVEREGDLLSLNFKKRKKIKNKKRNLKRKKKVFIKLQKRSVLNAKDLRFLPDPDPGSAHRSVSDPVNFV